MIIDAETEFGQKTKIIDWRENEEKNVKSYNTETKEAEIYATLTSGKFATIYKDQRNRSILPPSEGMEVVTFKCNLVGTKAVDKISGEEIIDHEIITTHLDYALIDYKFPIAIGIEGSGYLPREKQKQITRKADGSWEGVGADNLDQVKIVLNSLFYKWNDSVKGTEFVSNVRFEEGDVNDIVS